MIAYFVVLLIIIIAPLLYLHDDRISLKKKLPTILLSTLPVIVIFWVWDAIFTAQGIWHFNSRFTTGLTIAGLPVEEVLFFPVVAVSMLFIWEIVKYYVKNTERRNGKTMVIVWVIVMCMFVVGNSEKMYTLVVVFTNILTSIVLIKWGSALIESHRFWIFTCISILPFVLINTILTALPIVTYNPEEYTGIRIGTIPLEDFFYCFALLSLYIWSYEQRVHNIVRR